MSLHKKSKFTDETRRKSMNLRYRKRKTIFMHKFGKKKKEKRKPVKNASKKLFNSNAPINKQRAFKRRKIFIIAFAVILLISYLLFFTKFFTVKTFILLEDQEQTENTQIQRIIEPLRNKNLLLVNTESVHQSLKDNIDNLSELEIKKKFPSTIQVSYAKFKKVANLANYVGAQKVKKNFTINENGILIEKDKISPDLPFISIQTSKGFNLNDQVIKKQKLDYMLGAEQSFIEKFNMQVKEIQYLPKAREIYLRTERNFDVWLDIQIPYEDQLAKLKNAIPKIDIYNDSLQYIDLRIQSAEGQKIIYKRN